MHTFIFLLMLHQSVARGPIRPGDFGNDLTADEIAQVLYLAISCAQGDRVTLQSVDPSRVERALTYYWKDVRRAKTLQDVFDATQGYFNDLKWARLQAPIKVFVDALTGKQRPWPSYCDKDDMYSNGGSRYLKWYQWTTLQEYGWAMRQAGDKWNVPVTGLLLQGITESNMMHLLSQGNCKPLTNADGSYQLNPRTLAPLCASPIRPDEKVAWTEGQPGIDYGAWQISYSVATRHMTPQQRKDWVHRVNTIAGAADIAGRWWHMSSNGQCDSAIAEGRWKRACGERPEFKYESGETSEEGTARWRKKVGGFLFCNSCRGSYRMFGSAIAYTGRKFQPGSAAIDMWEDRIEPALRKVREKRLWGWNQPLIPDGPSFGPSGMSMTE